MTRAMATMATMAALLQAFSVAAAAEESSCPAAAYTKGAEELKVSFEEFRAASAAETKGLRVMIEAVLASRAGTGEGNRGDGGGQGGGGHIGGFCLGTCLLAENISFLPRAPSFMVLGPLALPSAAG